MTGRLEFVPTTIFHYFRFTQWKYFKYFDGVDSKSKYSSEVFLSVSEWYLESSFCFVTDLAASSG
jgi:hypothetical protein